MKTALVLAVSLAFPAIPATAADRHTIRLIHPDKPGAARETVTTVEVDNAMTFSVNGKVFREDKQRETWKLRARETVVSVARTGEPEALTIEILEFTKRADGGVTATMLPTGTLLQAGFRGGKENFTSNGEPVAPQAAKMLERLIALSDGSSDDDELYGTTEKRKVGETWPINAARVAEAMGTQDLQVDSRNIAGFSKLAAVKKSGKKDFLEIETTLTAKDITVKFIPGFKVVRAVNETRFDALCPADDSTGRVQEGMDTRFEIIGKGRRSPDEPEVTAVAKTKVNIRRTLRHLN